MDTTLSFLLVEHTGKDKDCCCPRETGKAGYLPHPTPPVGGAPLPSSLSQASFPKLPGASGPLQVLAVSPEEKEYCWQGALQLKLSPQETGQREGPGESELRLRVKRAPALAKGSPRHTDAVVLLGGSNHFHPKGKKVSGVHGW